MLNVELTIMPSIRASWDVAWLVLDCYTILYTLSFPMQDFINSSKQKTAVIFSQKLLVFKPGF